MFALTLVFLLASIAPSTAQDPSAFPEPVAPEEEAQPAAAALPSDDARLHDYLSSAFGPAAAVNAAVSSGIQQWRGVPAKWGRGGGAFLERFASGYGEHTIAESATYGLSSLLSQETWFQPCACSGTPSRLRHAVASPFTARNRERKTVLSPVRLLGLLVGHVVAAAMWYPGRHGVRAELRGGSVGVAGLIGTDLAQEFVRRPAWLFGP
jgi:hypothetical protein